MSGTASVTPREVRAYLGASLVITCITAWFSYAYFHIDEYFQVIELTRLKLGQISDWGLPWEHAQRMRPWLQPFLYWLIARVLAVAGVHDIWTLTFAFRLVTGLANVGALALFVKATLPWYPTDEEKRLHLRVSTLAGFLPYLFVRTSSESGSMAALTIAFAILLDGASALQRDDAKSKWTVPSLDRPLRLLFAGVLFGAAFEMRFQTALIAIGVVLWLAFIGRARVAQLALVVAGGVLSLGLSALVDRWGYGVWTFPAWTYFKANVLEGAAGFFGTDPPFAYLWLTPANVFMPILAALMLLAIVAWIRCPRHPVTWATLPFFVIHNLLAHKEERFLFPMAILATALVAMAIGPSSSARLPGISAWGWRRRRGAIGVLLGTSSVLGMLLLMFVPLGWHHNVRFMRFLHDRLGDELHATALPDINLNQPPFHPRVYDVDKADPEEIARRIDAGTARPFVLADRPVLHTGVDGLDRRVTVEWSELPFYEDRAWAEKAMGWIDRYNRTFCPPSRPLKFRTLYRIHP